MIMLKEFDKREVSCTEAVAGPAWDNAINGDGLKDFEQIGLLDIA